MAAVTKTPTRAKRVVSKDPTVRAIKAECVTWLRWCGRLNGPRSSGVSDMARHILTLIENHERLHHATQTPTTKTKRTA